MTRKESAIELAQRTANRDGYDRDDLGASPDF